VHIPLAEALAALVVKFHPQLVVLQRAVRMVAAVVGQVQAVQETPATTEMAQGAQSVLSGPELSVNSHQLVQGTYK
jgi:hypothetical protein